MGAHLRIRGRVQGVGFRPTVARLARARGLKGFVRNDADGVLIGLAANPESTRAFLRELLDELPPLAEVESVERGEGPVDDGDGFVIVESAAGAPRTEVAPDARTCPACEAEVLDPTERRYRYPFTNCTHCGPRFTITAGIPYDRPQTSMASFAMCEDCRAEYEDEADRRYHAQPIACHVCGPRASLERMDGQPFASDRFTMMDDVDAVGGLLLSGEIVAVKGLGGFHLCCDATNADAVRTLRERKRRPHKAFALMVRDLEVARRYVEVTEEDAAVLEGPAAPILLLPRTAIAAPAPAPATAGPPPLGRVKPPRPVVDEVAPDHDRLGVMLPTTPLHQLMLRRVDRPIVCTSGNLTEEPQCVDDDEAKERLAGIADWILLHDRPIQNRIDDSVVTRMDGGLRVLRRARGYAPASLPLPAGFEEAPPILALGGEYKAVFAMAQDGRAILSPHLGDLDHPAAYGAFTECLDLLTRLYGHRPAAVAFDRHPAYRTHELGRNLALGRGLPTVEILHHHAHVAACLAEHGRPRSAPPVLGLALDGLGYGQDGALWGGELLLCDYDACERVGTIKPVAMLGNDRASREPWRNLYAHLRAEQSWPELDAHFGDTEPVAYLRQKPVALLEQLLEKGTAAPLASSTGRLFDAVAAALGIRREGIEYEAQAAMILEGVVTDEALEEARREPYPFGIPLLNGRGLPYVEPLAMWRALLGDLHAGTDPALISARFHLGFAGALVRLVLRAVKDRRDVQPIDSVALSGGCFQNRVLLEAVAGDLRAAGLHVLTHRQVPPNDACLALGQAVLAAARLTPPNPPTKA
jgi:hydrogenase maturation protein HypF